MPKTYIATDKMLVGATEYIWADRVDVDRLIAEGIWSERTADSLKDHGFYAELSREKFQGVAARRPEGSPWPPRGFTEAFLVEAGVLDAPQTPTAETVTHTELTEDKIAVGPYFIQPKKAGRFTFFDVAGADGKLLRASAFRSADKAREFLEELFTNPAGAVTSEDDNEEGGDDDLQLRHSAEPEEGSGPPADR